MSTRSLLNNLLLLLLFVQISSYQLVDNATHNIEPNLSGGSEAIPHEAPWMISIQRIDYSTFGFNHICGGSIIQPHIILTAAHCLLDFRLESGYVYAGRHNLNESELFIQQNRSFGSSDIVIHEEYSFGIAPNDIGLIKLSNPLVINNYVKTVTLPLFNVIPYGSVRLYGWGETVYVGSGGILMTAATKIIDIKECNRNFTSNVLDTNICTSSYETAACAGDSGGAVIQRSEDGVDVAVGLVSWGFRLCGIPPSVHTRVSAYIDWIQINSAIQFQSNIQNLLAVCMISLQFFKFLLYPNT